MRCGEDTVLTGKTEWAVINTATHKLVPLEGIYPVELRFENGTAAPEPFARIADHFEGIAPYAEYQVRSTDIDVGGHMNNTAYVRMIMGSLSNEERKALTIRRMDTTIFRASCYEGNVRKPPPQRDGGWAGYPVSRGRDGSAGTHPVKMSTGKTGALLFVRHRLYNGCRIYNKV